MITNELRLARLCACLQIKEAIKAEIIKLIRQGDLDWEFFLDLVRQEGVGALAFKSIGKDPEIKEAIPAGVYEQLENIYYCTLGKNILLSKELEEVAGLLEKENIELIIFKGLMLAETLYQDLGLRTMSDIDILAREDDLIRINSLLKRIGYFSNIEINEKSGFSFTALRNSILYFKNKGTTTYWHLYWHLINSLPYNRSVVQKFRMSKVWGDSEIISLGKIKLRAFSLYHQIIYLCFHAMGHSFRPLILLCDIKEFIGQNSHKIDWDILIKEALGMGLEKYLYYGLYFSRMVLAMEEGEVVLNKLKPKRLSLFEKRFIISVLERRQNIGGEGLVFLGMNENILDRILFLRRIILPSRKEMAFIRQKDISRINSLDYFHRFKSAFLQVFKFLIWPK